MSSIPVEHESAHRGDVAAGRGRSGFRDALWLAGQELRRTWLGYIVSAIYLLVLSLLTIGMGDLLDGVMSIELVLLAMSLILTTPFFARDYMNWSNDPVAERLAWFRSLPIDTRTIVRSRALCLLAAAPLNFLAYLVPLYLADEWSLDAGSFLLFGVSLFGLSLVSAGVHLCLELGVSLRRWLMTGVVVMVPAILLVVVLQLVVDIRLFAELARSVERHGLVVALVCLAVGIASFLALGRLADRVLRRRELAT